MLSFHGWFANQATKILVLRIVTSELLELIEEPFCLIIINFLATVVPWIVNLYPWLSVHLHSMATSPFTTGKSIFIITKYKGIQR